MEMPEIREQLKSIGLGENEAKAYLACLELGSSMASQIAGKSGIYRTIIYDVLNSLIEKGIVSCVIRENRKYFQAAPPAALIKYLDEKERMLQSQKERAMPLIEKLASIEHPVKEPYSIEVFSGSEGFKSLLEDVLKEGKDYRMLGFEGIGGRLVKYYYAHWQRRRIRQGIRRHIVAKKSKKGAILKHRQLTYARFLPDNYEIPTSVLIYGRKSILFLPFGDDIVSIRIDSEKIANSFNTYFEMMWRFAKK